MGINVSELIRKEENVFDFQSITNENNNSFLVNQFKLLLSTEIDVYKKRVWEHVINVLVNMQYVITGGEQILSLKIKGIGKGTAKRIDAFLEKKYTFNKQVEFKDTISCLVAGIICDIGQRTERQKNTGKDLIKTHFNTKFIPEITFDIQRKQDYLATSKDFKKVDKDLKKNEVFQIPLNKSIILISNIFQISKDGETIILYNRYDNKDKFSWGSWKKEELECQMICNMAVCRAKKAIMKFTECDDELTLDFCEEKWKKFFEMLQKWSNCEICNSSSSVRNNYYERIFTEHGTWCDLCEQNNMCLETTCSKCFQKSFEASKIYTFFGNKAVDCWNKSRNNGKTPRMIQSFSNKPFYFDCDSCHKTFQRNINEIHKWCPYCCEKRIFRGTNTVVRRNRINAINTYSTCRKWRGISNTYYEI